MPLAPFSFRGPRGASALTPEPTPFRLFGSSRLELRQGDLTDEATDAIVNAANSSLMGGGGVDGAIHRRGGPAILEDCRKIRDRRGPLPTGEAVITTAGHLPCRHVIHTVGPVWQGGAAGEPALLAQCYEGCLALAAEHGLQSIAFPSLSTGAFGYPIDRAAPVAIGAVALALSAGSTVTLVRFVLFSAADRDVYQRALESVAP